MKTVNIILVCLLMGIVLSQQTCSLTDANNKNVQVLKWLKSKNIVLFDEPKLITDKTICNAELSTHGTCCDVESMKKLAVDLNKGMIDKWAKYINRLVRVKGKFQNGFKKVASKMNVDDVKNKMSTIKANLRIVDKFKLSESIVPETSTDVTKLKTFADKFEDQLSTFKEKGQVCFDALKRARSNFLCAACSARASDFSETQSTTEAKIKIDYETCNAIVVKCFPVWQFNFQLNSMMQYMLINLSKKRGDSSKNNFKSEKEMTATVLSKLRETFRNCKLADASATSLTCEDKFVTAEDYTKDLCSKAFSVNNQNGYLEGDESVDSDVDDDDVESADALIEIPPIKPPVVIVDPRIIDPRILPINPISKRLLQSSSGLASTFDMGTTVSTTGTYNTLNSGTTAIEPKDSVSTANAGTSTVSTSNAGLTSVWAFLHLFLFWYFN